MPSSLFTYRALTPEKSRIRLIHFSNDLNQQSSEDGGTQPSQSHDLHTPISCGISHVTLEQAPPYVALSYVWGDTKSRSAILLNGIPVFTTKNLAIALLHLKGRVEEPYLWVDALCIDQNNKVEKTEQVQQMQHIYSRAVRVIAWIGPVEQDSDRAIRWLQSYGKVAKELGIGSKPELQLRKLLQNRSMPTSELSGSAPLESFIHGLVRFFSMKHPEDRATMLALSKIPERAVWTRFWIVQEMVHARVVSFWCGNLIVDEDHLHHAMRLLRNFMLFKSLNSDERMAKGDETIGSLSIDTRNPVNLLKIRRARQKFPLIYLIRTLRRFHATDSRDRIFAVLNCASDTELLQLRPDYLVSCEHVYTDTTLALLNNGYFDILALCDPKNNKMALPSWVPDLTSICRSNPLQQRALLRHTNPMVTDLQPSFAASQNSFGSEIVLESTEEGTATLLLQANLVGEVERVGPPWVNQSVEVWVDGFKNILLPEEMVDETRQLEEIIRTLVADQEIRQGNSKPRLSAALLQRVTALFVKTGLGPVTAEDFILSGNGEYLHQMTSLAVGRRPIYTSDGRLGIGPADAQCHDLVYVLLGSTVPHVLRRMSQDSLCLVGEAFINGIMDGEALKPDGETQTIRLR